MSDSDVKRVDFFDRKSSRPVCDVIIASVEGRRGADFPSASVSAGVIRQSDAKKLVAVKARPVEGQTGLRISLQVSSLSLGVLKRKL